jgi:type IV pilus assembly protein PilQ
LTSITNITTDPQGDAFQIVVGATDEVKYTTLRLQQPLRLAVDIADATLSPDVKPVMFPEGIVSGVEPITFADEHVVRVLIPLRQPASHLVTTVGKQLRIALSADSSAANDGAIGDSAVDDSAVDDYAIGDSAVDDSAVDDRAAEVTVDNSGAEPHPGAVTVAALPEAMPTAQANEAGTLIHGVEFLSLPGASVIEVQVAGSLPQIRVKQQTSPLRLMMDVKNARLNPNQDSLMAVHDPAGVVAQLQALQGTHEDTDTVHIVAFLKAKASFEVRQHDDRVRVILTPPLMQTATDVPVPDGAMAASMPLIAQAAPMASPYGAMEVEAPLVAQSTPAVPETDTSGVPPRIEAATIGEVGEKTYTGEKISLDFQNADINDILRLIAEVSRLNIITGPDVKGTVTTRMVDIPWDQALDVVLKINGLGQEQQGNIIRVAPIERFINEHQERMRIQKAEEEAEPTVKQVVPINYANVEELKTNLERVLSPRGSLWIDSRTNTMIVTDVKENVKHVIDLVQTLDRQTPQVMIESRIVEASRNFLKELGVRLGTRFAQTTDNNFPSTINVDGGIAGGDSGNFLVDLPAAVGVGSGGAITFALAGASSMLNLQLSALENSGNGKVVTNPKIATLDNTEALIESGRRIPYPTRDDNGTKIEFADASIQLRVTPHVAPDGFINLKIHATKNEADFSNAVQGVPTILTREATTEMLVRDGATVVIGGLYQRSLQAAQSGIPWLSNVPGIGWLFRNTRDNDTHEELLIFITPRIIRQPDVPSKAHASVMN